MKFLLVTTGCVAPFNKRSKRTSLFLSFAIYSLFALTGCFSAKTSAPLAPRPPQVVAVRSNTINVHYNDTQPSADVSIAEDGGILTTMPAHLKSAYGLENRTDAKALSLSKKPQKPVRCRLKDRFDRKAVLAYRWGRNRLALDVDGVNIASTDIEGVKLEYKLRMHPEKSWREKCLYASGWQGLIGSGYNELIARENDTVYKELRKIRIDVQNKIEGFF